MRTVRLVVVTPRSVLAAQFDDMACPRFIGRRKLWTHRSVAILGTLRDRLRSSHADALDIVSAFESREAKREGQGE
jgi:hypothetical protein